VEVGRAIARSNLFKCAVFGGDPNWGRVLAAIGTTAADFEPDRIDVSLQRGADLPGRGHRRTAELVDLSGREVRSRSTSATGRIGDHLDQRPHL
jgi:glutamate N-acetyltransferase/amino-acid N-acetyltransferase